MCVCEVRNQAPTTPYVFPFGERSSYTIVAQGISTNTAYLFTFTT